MKLLLLLLAIPAALNAQAPTLQELVTPTTVVYHEQKPLRFALYGLTEFSTLQEVCVYIDTQTGRWHFADEQARQKFADDLLQRGVEGRVVSMTTEKLLEVVLTHTRDQLDAAVARLPEPIFQGRNWRLDHAAYRAAFGRVRDRWSKGLNCWSASPVIAGRVLSNWYVIEEGFSFDGASYDSLEHVWQAIKYHPRATVADLLSLLDQMDHVNWDTWFRSVDRDQKVYLEHAHIIEFLRANLAPAKRAWFRDQLRAQPPGALVRQLQQRTAGKLRVTSYEEKTLWGDLADVFHLLVYLDFPNPSFISALRSQHFDGIYLSGRKLGFISPEFRALMLELWKQKYLRMPRFREVIRSIPREVKLEHFLNDGDSPDIPIPVYIAYLNQIRDMARTGNVP